MCWKGTFKSDIYVDIDMLQCIIIYKLMCIHVYVILEKLQRALLHVYIIIIMVHIYYLFTYINIYILLIDVF